MALEVQRAQEVRVVLRDPWHCSQVCLGSQVSQVAPVGLGGLGGLVHLEGLSCLKRKKTQTHNIHSNADICLIGTHG